MLWTLLHSIITLAPTPGIVTNTLLPCCWCQTLLWYIAILHTTFYYTIHLATAVRALWLVFAALDSFTSILLYLYSKLFCFYIYMLLLLVAICLDECPSSLSLSWLGFEIEKYSQTITNTNNNKFVNLIGAKLKAKRKDEIEFHYKTPYMKFRCIN